ncbi:MULTISPECIES: carboxyl transferase domain-containing protein [Pseudomonas]|nr:MULTISPECIES: carboxyl transferase domain-containing protein [Pseudomonas]KWS20624.1 propionyl-CoA carboxylase [Pseudomonas syringae pv. syringae]MCF5198391.1 propionyl-CoA carboxylase [Pseudomonas syringae]MCF5202131.1 propionyl-CoA carboxylase [Pseudomonas syringae]MCF5209652.1 propionyl-CoA carboxylase [Pseudomonas syringae]MCF5214396.1 propionyl-CoA carboxylase [Pseudomonas syringae]
MSVSERRVSRLFDPGSFKEDLEGQNTHFICGAGTIHSIKTYVAMSRGRDCEFQSSRQWSTAQQIIKTVGLARAAEAPLIYIQDKIGDNNDTEGFDTARVFSSDMSSLLLSPSGMGSVSASLAELAKLNLLMSVILGPTSGPLALPVMLADLVLMTRRGALCMGRPDMVKAMLAQQTDLYSLGGSDIHSTASGSVHLVFDDEADLFADLRKLLLYLIAGKSSTYGEFSTPLEVDFSRLLPPSHNIPFDVQHLVRSFVDSDSLIEIGASHAPEVLVGLASLQGQVFAVVANNSAHGGGVIYKRTARKMIHVIDLAGKMSLPILFIADIPGIMIGEEAERDGIFAAVADLFRAHTRCKVKKLLLVARKAYTGGVYAMSGPGFEPVAVLAYPDANIGVFSTLTMEKIIKSSSMTDAQRAVVSALDEEIRSPLLLKDKGLITDVISVRDTREAVFKYLFH